MSVDQKAPLSNRQRRMLRKNIAAQKATQPKAERPAPEVFEPAIAKHADDVIIPGLSGRGTVLRTDTLWKLYNTGKISPVQYSAGVDYLRIVENYFASASGLAKLSDEAGQVGGTRDPINRYLKARPMRLGYVPTQRPRKPASSRSHGDGWTAAKLAALGQFGKVSAMVQRLPVEQRRALCLIVIDPSAPDRPPIPITRVVELIYGSKGSRGFQRVVGWLARALDEMDQGLVEELRAA
jgi:hypothetical protein